MTRYAVSHEHPRRHACTQCGGIGIYYDPEVQAGRYGTLKICACIEQKCRCGGRAPFQCWSEDSERIWCPCRPYRQRLLETGRLFKEADLPSRYRFKFLDDFNTQTPDGGAVPNAPQLLAQVSTFTEMEGEPDKGFFFHGPPGTGKTLLSCITLNSFILRRGRPGLFLNLSRMYQKLRDTFSEESRNYGQTWPLLEEYSNVPYLVIDDFGIQRGTEWEMEMLYDLVDARYGAERFTIVTTNQSLDLIKQLSEGRIYSRLLEMCMLIEMKGEDYRQHL